MTIRELVVFAARWALSWPADLCHGFRWFGREWVRALRGVPADAAAKAKARHPSAVPGLPRDGRPLDDYGRRALGRIEMDALIGVPEVTYDRDTRRPS